MNNNETVVEYARSIGVDAQPDVVIELTEQGPQGTHGEKGDKGDTGTVTPEMLNILEQTKSSANDAAKSSANATEKANQASALKDEVVKTKQEVQDIKDAAVRDVTGAAQSLTDLVSKSEKNIKDVVDPALTKIQESKDEADAAIKDVKAARDITQSSAGAAKASADEAKTSADTAQASANDAQASVVKTAANVDNVVIAYNKIVKIEEDLNTLSAKTEATAKNIEASDKSVSDNYSAVKILKDDIDKTKSIIDDQSLKVSDALNEAQKIASDVSNNVASAAASSAAAEEAKTAAEKAATSANDAATIVSSNLTDIKTFTDKVEALKPSIDDALTKNSAINNEISINKTEIENLCADAKDSADKANTAETNVNSVATKITADKTAIENIRSSIDNTSKDIATKLDQVNTAKNEVSEDAKAVKTAKDSVENKWNDFSTIYYGASSTPPSGDIKLGALWLDTSETPEVLKKYLSSGWEVVAATDVYTKTEINDLFSNITASNIKETDNGKVMTADERNKVANLDNTYLAKAGGTITGDLIVDRSIRSGSITTNGWIAGEYKGDLAKGTAGVQLSCSQNNSYVSQWVIRGDGSTAIWTKDYGDVAGFRRDGSIWAGNYFTIGDKTYWFNNGDITGSIWENNSLHHHIENRAWQQAHDQAIAAQNWCVTDSRVAGWVQLDALFNNWAHMPSGYVMCDLYQPSGGGAQLHFGGRQPQLYIANIGWFALGGW